MLDKYFSRRMPWSALNEEQIVVHDAITPHAPRMITMEPWHQIIYLAANGEHTVAHLVEKLGSMYDGGAPDGLADQVVELIQILESEMVLEVHDSPKELPEEFREDCLAKGKEEAAGGEEQAD